jgi:hypothetical protein
MASNFSTNLKIELINQGEQAGQWGNTTNTNLGTAIEEAIVGYGNPNFTSDADLTLTLTNANSTQVARNLVLNVTSVTLSATRSLIVPNIEKPYVVQNNTTGGQSILVKTSGGAGVTIPNGKSAIVYVDGTNVVSQITHIPDLTLATALPVASGGTGAATLTANNVLLGNGTSAVQEVAPGTSGNLLTSDGTTWTSAAAPDPVPSGTAMLFAQTAAPTGWTKSTAHDNKALRVVSGTASSGGSVDFTTAFASGLSAGGTALTTSQLPAHYHNSGPSFFPSDSANFLYSYDTVSSTGRFVVTNSGSSTLSPRTSTVGSGSTHDHTLPSFEVSYVDVIIATKD